MNFTLTLILCFVDDKYHNTMHAQSIIHVHVHVHIHAFPMYYPTCTNYTPNWIIDWMGGWVVM